MQDLFYDLALVAVPNITPLKISQILSRFGSAEEFFKHSSTEIAQILMSNEGWIFNDFPNCEYRRAEKELEFIEKKEINVMRKGANNYPYRLSKCADAPHLLFSYGNAKLSAEKVIGVVGTRNISDYGRKMVNQFIADLAEAHPNTLVVSGLAYGVDQAAHRCSLEKNLPTVGVLAHGLDYIYPSGNRNLAKEMVQGNGAVVTEFLTQTQPLRPNFLQRNRIIAGLSDATIVIESAIKGGSLNTARLAFEYDRTVFAVPGRVGDKFSEGCNRLIANNAAQIYTNIDDMSAYLNWDIIKKPKEPTLFSQLDGKAGEVVAALGNETLHIDLIANRLGWETKDLRPILTNLLFDDIIMQLPGDRFLLTK